MGLESWGFLALLVNLVLCSVNATRLGALAPLISANRNHSEAEKQELLDVPRFAPELTSTPVKNSDSISHKLRGDIDQKLEPTELWQQEPMKRPHHVLLSTQLCTAGQFVSSSGCQDCNPGTFMLSYTPHSNRACTECAPGTFQAETASHECHKCPVGKFSARAGASECLDCEPGTYGDSSGATTCQACTAGVTFQTLPGKQFCDACGVAPESLVERCGNEAVPACAVDGWNCACLAPGHYFSSGHCHKCQECDLSHNEAKPCRAEQDRECVPNRGFMMLQNASANPLGSGFALAAFLVVLILELLPTSQPIKECRLAPSEELTDATYGEVSSAVEFIGGFMSGISKQPTNFASLLIPISGITSDSELGQRRRAGWGMVHLHLTKAFNLLLPEEKECCWKFKLPEFLARMGCVGEATARVLQDSPIAATEIIRNFISFLTAQLKASATNAHSVASEVLADQRRLAHLDRASQVWHQDRWTPSESGSALGEALHTTKFTLSAARS